MEAKMKEKRGKGKGILGALATLLFPPSLIIAGILSMPMLLLTYCYNVEITMSIKKKEN